MQELSLSDKSVHEVWQNHVWIFDSVLSSDDLEYLKCQALSADQSEFSTRMNKCQTAKSSYRYWNLNDGIRSNQRSISILNSAFSMAFSHIGHGSFSFTVGQIESTMLQTRFFDENSFIDLHMEDLSVFPAFAYALFLTDTVGGELVFYSKDSTMEWIQCQSAGSDLEPLSKLFQTQASFPDADIVIEPMANRLVLFRIQSPHGVAKVREFRGKETRLSINGWINPQ